MDVPPDLRITVTDIRLAGYCASGIRRWFEDHEFDFRDFLKNGIEAEKLLATGDALAERVVGGKADRQSLELDVPADLVITAEDVRSSMQCEDGAFEWAARFGFDYERGASARNLIATGDREAIRVVRDALERRKAARGRKKRRRG